MMIDFSDVHVFVEDMRNVDKDVSPALLMLCLCVVNEALLLCYLAHGIMVVLLDNVAFWLTPL